MSEKTFVVAAILDDLPPGGKKLVELNGVPVLLCHTLDQVFAVRNVCSHAEQPLDCGRMRSGWIACPVHGARFDLETGEALGPPATLPIQTFPARINGGVIEVEI